MKLSIEESLAIAPRVAVYGTLKRGWGNHVLLSRSIEVGASKFLGEHVTAPEFTMHHLGGFPCVVPGGETGIHIEVFEVDHRTMVDLDRLEGYPSFYDRQLVDTPYGKAWMYIHHKSSAPVVKTGNWTKETRSERSYY